MVTTFLGSWLTFGDTINTTVGATVLDAISGGDIDWRERVGKTGSLARMVDEYRQAINEALPPGFSLFGDDFYGPYYQDTYGREDIKEIVQGVDLDAIINRHDPDNT